MLTNVAWSKILKSSNIVSHIDIENIYMTLKLIDYQNSRFFKEFIDTIKEVEELLKIGFSLLRLCN